MFLCLHASIKTGLNDFMKTLVINSQKGGSGKTMLAKHLAVEANRAGDGEVYLIDTDPQGTLTGWHERRESEQPHRVDVSFDGIPKALEIIKKQGAGLCIIDTASGRLDIASELFKLADLVLFPIQASDDDLSAAPVTIQNLKQQSTPFMFILTRVKPNTLITAQAAATLSKHGQVAETLIADRTAYKSRYEAGKTIIEVEPKGQPSKEIAGLWQNIKSCLHASNK
jgi:chromosome partitioning protein